MQRLKLAQRSSFPRSPSIHPIILLPLYLFIYLVLASPLLFVFTHSLTNSLFVSACIPSNYLIAAKHTSTTNPTFMTPNPLHLFLPTRWFGHRSKSPSKPVRHTEHWDTPVPGTYEHIPGRGWYLVAEDSAPDTRITPPKPVRHSRVLQRYLLEPEYNSRKRSGVIAADANGKEKQGLFFRLDDGVAWVKPWDEQGEFMPGPYERWCVDERTGRFRKMLRGDDPEWQSRRSSRMGSSRANSTAEGRDAARGNSLSAHSAPSTRPVSTKATTASGVSTPYTPGKSLTHEEMSRELRKRLTGLQGS